MKKIAPVVMSAAVAMTSMPYAVLASDFTDSEVLTDSTDFSVFEEFAAFIRAKCFGKKKKHGYPEEWVHRLQKVKYVLLAFLLLSCMTGFYSKLQGMSPWDVFSIQQH